MTAATAARPDGREASASRPHPPLRLSVEILQQRDKALLAIDAALDEVEKLEALEKGVSQGDQSPRHPKVKDIAGLLHRCGDDLDAAYV